MNMRMIITPKVVVALAASTLTLAACAPATAPSDSPAPTPTPSTPAAEDRPSTEHHEAQPRLVVTTASGTQVVGMEGGELVSLASFVETGAATVGPDGRHVYLVDADAGITTVLDSGSYAQGHGDHFHFFTREPGMRPDVIAGHTPVHVVGHDGRVAIFNDGDGTASVFDEIGLVAGGLTVETLTANQPHHGVAVPVAGGYLVTSSAEGGLPETVVQVDEHGHELTTYTDVCPGTHGEAVVDGLVAFGCAGHLAVIDPVAQTSTTIAYPAGAGEARVGTLWAAGEIAVGNFGAQAFLIIDVEGGTAQAIATEAPFATAAVTTEGTIAILTTDGVITVFDADGDELLRFQAMGAFELGEGHGAVRPSLVAFDEFLVVADTETNTLLLIDLHDGDVVSTLALGAQPTRVVATGLDPTAAAGHDHDHDHDHHEDDDHEDHDH